MRRRRRDGAGSSIRAFGQSIAAIVIVAIAVVSLPLVADASTPTLSTDKPDYAPGELVTVTGTGFEPNTTYDIPIIRPDGSIVLGDGSFIPGWDSTTTDANGDLLYLYQLNGITGSYEIRVYNSPWSGDRSETPVTSFNFLDAATADIDQCENGPLPAAPTACNWANGNLGEANSQYEEGDSVAFRMKMAGLAAGVHTATISYDSMEGGVHAYDYLTSWNETETGDPCASVTGCSGWTTSTFPIPLDSRVTAGPDGNLLTLSDNVTQIPGTFKLYGGVITAVSAYTHSNPVPNSGTNTTTITITFTTTTVTKPVLAWGGHIATREDWRPAPAAVTISGSPYHVTGSADGGNPGQAKSLKASAVTFPSKLTIVKNTVPDDAQNFSFSATGGTITPTSFLLDDDADPALSNTQTYSNIKNFTTYTFTEAAATGFALTNLACTVVDPNGGTQTPNTGTRTVTISLKEGEEVTCTFTNTKQATLTIKKDATPNDAQDFGFTTTGAGMSNFSLDDDADGTLSDTQVFTFPAADLGSKTVTESSVGGWSLTDISCTEGTEDEANRKATVQVDAGDQITCTFKNSKDAKLTIAKDALPDDAQDFGYTTTGTGMSDFSLDDDADPTLSATKVFTFTASQLGTKTVTETGVAGWSLANLSCSPSGTVAGAVATVNIQAGDDVTCTYKNSKNATLTIEKDAQPNDAQDFSFTTTGSGLSDFDLDDDADPTLSNSKTFTFTASEFGTKEITEAAAAGWSLTGLTCSPKGAGVTATRKATVDIQAGDSVTCRFTNVKHAKVTITKDADPNDAQDFSFSGGLGNFLLDDDGDPTLDNNKVFTLTAADFGPKTVTEAAQAGWSLQSISCSEGTVDLVAQSATFTVDAGDDITCTFTNQKDAFLTITKQADPESSQAFAFTAAGSGMPANFSLTDDGTAANTQQFTFQTGEYGVKTITETLPAGWDLADITCSKGTVNVATGEATVTISPGDNVTCTYENNKLAFLKIVKDSAPDDAQDFHFTTTGMPDITLDDDADATLPSSHQYIFATGDYGTKTIEEDAVAGWSLANLNCAPKGIVAGAKATINIVPGDDVTCTFKNEEHAKVTITKDADPNDAQDFSFSGDLGTFDLDDDADPTLDNDEVITVRSPDFGAKTVTEAAQAGWSLASVTCSEGTTNVGTRSATFTVDPGDDITCTFKNEKDAKLTIVKDTLPDSAQLFDFTTTGAGMSDFQLEDDGAGSNAQSFTFTTGQFGTKTVAEGTAAGWSLSTIACSKGTTNTLTGTATIAIVPGDDVTCTYTNSEDASLLIVKDAVPNDAQDFSFTSTGAAMKDFDLDDDTNATLPSSELFTFKSGEFDTKTVTEAVQAGWTLTDITCSKGTGDTATRKATVTIAPGDHVTCTFKNVKDAQVTITKDADPNDAQDFSFSGDLGNFDLDDDADGTLDNDESFTIAAADLGPKTVTEAAQAGWSLAAITCSEGTSNTGTRSATFTVDAGDNITCTFKNEKDASVTITKDADPNDAQDFSFSGDLGNFDLDDDADATLDNDEVVTVSSPDFGAKTVTEAAQAGWSVAAITCSEGTTNVGTRSATFTVDPGDVIDCTYKNEKAASLTINKDADPNDAQDFHFTTTGIPDITLDDDGDPTLLSSHIYTFSTGDYGTKTIEEDAVAGWSLASLTCSEGTVVGAKATISIDPGDTVTCTFKNEKDATVTITKDADPDDAQDFDFAGDLGAFTLDDDPGSATPASETQTFKTGQFGAKSVTEAVTAGWDLTDIACSEGIEDEATRTATVTVDAGDVITCTFHNRGRGAVEVTKLEAGVAAGAGFTFTLTGGPAPGVNLTQVTTAGNHVLTFSNLVPGTYKLCETVPAGYTSDLGPDAFGDPCEAVTITPGTTTAVTVDNTPCATGTITIETTIPDVLQGAETETFTYQISTPGGVLITTVNVNFAAGQTVETGSGTVNLAGDYVVTEVPNAPWAPNAPVTVTVSTPTCAVTQQFSSNFGPPTARVVKTTLPAGNEAGWTFTLRENGVPIENQITPAGGTVDFITGLGEETYTILETPRLGFTQISASGCSFTVDLPADADRVFTCRVTNAQDGTGTIVKLEKLGGGKLRKAKGSWEFYVRGGPDNINRKMTLNENGLKHKASLGQLKVGAYTVCEKYFKGWKSNLGGKNAVRLVNGDRCVAFTVNAAQSIVFRVVNTCSSAAKAKMP